MKYKFQ